MFRFKLSSGVPKSVIDRENGKIVLRSSSFPEGRFSVEWIISGDTIVINRAKKGDITETETIQISQVRRMDLGVKMQMHAGTLEIRGKSPKSWYHEVYYNGSDIFVAQAAYAYIFAKRQGDLENPLKTSIPPEVVELRRQLDAGEIESQVLEEFRAKGMSF